jgi:teichuronic acid biosynthesis glycosyltransferase TuaC
MAIMKNLLILSHMFPNRNDPRLGIFVHDQLQALKKYYRIQVIAPVPWFPPVPGFQRWARHRSLEFQAEYQGIPVVYPRRLTFPKGYGQVIMACHYDHVVHRLCRTLDFDIIHSHGVWPDGYVASRIGRSFGKPVVITSHGADTYRFLRNLTTGPLVRSSIRRADRLIAVSSADAQFIRQHCDIKDKLAIISNGVDVQQFHPQSTAAVRSQLGLPVDKQIIVFVGYLYPVKGVSSLLTAMTLLNSPDTHLVLVGDGFLRQTLEQQVRETHLQDRVHFVGEQPHDRIPLWMNCADVFCLPSLNEGWPTVLFEALACGKPVVATNVGGIPEAINDARYGILVEPGQPHALAQALQNALVTNWKPAELVAYACRHSWQAKADMIHEQIYQPLLG